MNAKDESNCSTISVRIPTELKLKVDLAAAAERSSRTAWVTRALCKVLEQQGRLANREIDRLGYGDGTIA